MTRRRLQQRPNRLLRVTDEFFHDGTVFTAAYGTMERHRNLIQAAFSEDAYSLLTARSAALGFATPLPSQPRYTLWAMNDAGQNWVHSEAETCLAWFQVMTRLGQEHSPLQALASTMSDMLALVGEVDLTQVDVMFPAAASFNCNDLVLRQSTPWFELVARDWVVVTVSLTIGEGSDTERSLESVVSRLREAGEGAPRRVREVGDLVPFRSAPSPVAYEMWVGGSARKLRFRAEIPEWSLISVGWLAGWVAWASGTSGFDTSVLLKVRLADHSVSE